METEEQKRYAKTQQALVKLYQQAQQFGMTAFLTEHGLGEAAHPTLVQLSQTFVTQDPVCKQLFRHAALLAHPYPDPVIIYGETGTGKELLARAISQHDAQLFKAINVTSLPDYLVESELFGHVKGSFTGAVDDKRGLLEGASTVFLDEIGDLPLTIQPKLLRAIQSMMVRPVGALSERSITCRFIAATHRNLEAMVQKWYDTDGAKGFRPDLYWRLAVHELRIPPLRERPCDIPLLIKHFDPSDTITPADIDCTLPFHGNVRELQALVKRALIKRKLA